MTSRPRCATGCLAEALGAKARHIPMWVAPLFMGEGLAMITESRGASNARARRELGWVPRYPTWREGFFAAYCRGAVEAGV